MKRKKARPMKQPDKPVPKKINAPSPGAPMPQNGMKRR